MPAEGAHIILKMTACHFLLEEHNLKLCINSRIMLFLISVFIVPLNLSQCPKCCENTAQLHQMSGMVWIILDLILISKYEPTKNANMEGNLWDIMEELIIQWKRKRRENRWKSSKIQTDE